MSGVWNLGRMRHRFDASPELIEAIRMPAARCQARRPRLAARASGSWPLSCAGRSAPAKLGPVSESSGVRKKRGTEAPLLFDVS